MRTIARSSLLSALLCCLANGQLSQVKTVFIILLENHNWSDIAGSSSAPYINNTLLPMSSFASQYFNPPGNHPSLPNYLWLESGTNFGILDDNDPSVNHQSTTSHLATQLTSAGVTWKSYQESITGTDCPLTGIYPYAPRHNPFVYFDDVTGANDPNSATCIAHVRPYTELATDLTNQTQPRYIFITPHLCDDMHDSCAPLFDPIRQGDNWLSTEVPKILASQPYLNGGALFITWDEGEGSDGPIGMIVLSSLAKGGGYRNTIHYTHGSTLRTFEEIFGVPLLRDASSETDLSDLFKPEAPPALSIAKSHTGNFAQGQSNAIYTVVVSNLVTAGPANGTVTVAETLPTGLTMVSMSGTGWSCGSSACTRSDTLAAGSSYPPITVTVNVAAGAPSQVTNQVALLFGGDIAGTASDPTTIGSGTAITIGTSPSGLRFSIDSGAALTSPQTLLLSPGSHNLAVAAVQPGSTGTQYQFTGWADGTQTASRSITVGATAATYTANFATQFLLSISASPAAGGTVTPSSGFYTAGTVVPITATPNAGYIFAGWTGPVVSPTSASTSVAMSVPATVVANFTPPPSQGLRFVPVTPCRVIDTRNPTGPFGGPSIPAGGTRTVNIPQSACSIPASAQAYSLNVTVVPVATLTYLSIWPAGQTQPVVSTLNSFDGRIVANAAIVPAGTSGGISLFASDATNVILDINGYFVPASTAGSLSFYSVTPCRIADTRNPNGPLGGPFLAGNSSRSFPVPTGSCGSFTGARAYSLNITVVPRRPLGYLTSWPTGQTQPVVSTLNANDGNVVANAAIVPAGTAGAISIFVTDDTDVIIDINGYFAPPGSPSAQSLYTVTPCRVADTRGGFNPPFGSPSLVANAQRSFPIPSGVCTGIPSNSQAYSLNVTVVPPGPLTYLTAWPTGQTQPVVSTLNSFQGKVVANAAIVPAGQNGAAISVFVTNPTNLILDINGYFAP
ncbi:MAG TPA: alkaline phosphatase family protein [Bryobacteraceae bacterium]|nr:alkaline phosphatase family protein [Bryobacteraceae bacterium]